MNIGEVAKQSGVSAKMIRYYESVGLIQRSHRSESGYRVYCESDVRTLRFLKLARNAGFSIEEIRELLSLWLNPTRSAADVGAMVQGYVKELEKRIEDATEMRDALSQLAQTCDGSSKH